MTMDQLVLTLRIVAAALALLALGGWSVISTFRWPHFDIPDKILCLAVGVLLFTITLAFSIRAASGSVLLPVALFVASLAGLCAAEAYRLKHRGLGHIANPLR